MQPCRCTNHGSIRIRFISRVATRKRPTGLVYMQEIVEQLCIRNGTDQYANPQNSALDLHNSMPRSTERCDNTAYAPFKSDHTSSTDPIFLAKPANPFLPISFIHNVAAIGHLAAMSRVVASGDRDFKNPSPNFHKPSAIHLSCSIKKLSQLRINLRARWSRRGAGRVLIKIR